MKIKSPFSENILDQFLQARGYLATDRPYIINAIYEIANENNLAIETIMKYIESIT